MDEGLGVEFGAAQVDQDADEGAGGAQGQHHEQWPEEVGGRRQGRQAGHVDQEEAQPFHRLDEGVH